MKDIMRKKEIIIKRNEDGSSDVTKNGTWNISDAVNAYAVCLAAECCLNFKSEKAALNLLEMAYKHSKSTITQFYEGNNNH